MSADARQGAGARSLSDWLTWQERLHPSAIDLGLERLARTLERLEWRPPACPVVTIGGTNGKGSSVALAARILGEAGYRVGTLTSPHLIRYNERITIAGREVSDASLIAAFERIDAARGTDTLTFFEFNTLAALLVFETAGCDAWVLEVGMGGRLDAVNAVDADVALITSIGLDHCEWLGTDSEAIGREKAGILRSARPAVFAAREMPASIDAVARELGSELRRLGRDFDFERGEAGWTWRGRECTHERLPAPALHGDIQYDNAAGVLAALECLGSRLPVARDALERGLMGVRLPGRFQILLQSAPRRIEWILDVAHNPAAARALAAQLAARPAERRTLAVCGILGDKDIEGIGEALRSSIDTWIVVRPESARALEASALAARLENVGVEIAATALGVAAGCRVAQSHAHDGDRIVVFGSFLTVGPALEALNAQGLRAG